MTLQELKDFGNKNGYKITVNRGIMYVRFRTTKKPDELQFEFMKRILAKGKKIEKKIEKLNYEYLPSPTSYNYKEWPLVKAKLEFIEKEVVI